MKTPVDSVRRDLSRFFTTWLLLANGLWAATPWLDPLAPVWGAVWLWTIAIPGLSLAVLHPRRALGLALATAALIVRAATELARPCRFRRRKFEPTTTA